MDRLEIRVRGRVQGVGFRPTVWRLARELGLEGHVANDAEGVLIRATGAPEAMASFLGRLAKEPPPLAQVDTVASARFAGDLAPGFWIVDSESGVARTQVAPDAAICAACAAEVLDPSARRAGYPFTTCTHCGPRLSVVTGVPFDRARTTLRPFPLCEPCAAEYADPADRRFHAETTACPSCGPRARLLRLEGAALDPLDAVAAAAELLQQGEIVALKGVGGFHLACDATHPEAVSRLRDRKRREGKPFALMARDLDVIRRYCDVSPVEAAALASPEAPIVLLTPRAPATLPDAIAPGLGTLGFMLPTTPLHLILLQGMDRPVVMTSGNLAGAPQISRDEDVRRRLIDLAEYALVHDREIAHRIDDSLVRVMGGEVRVLRRARGYAPAPLALPPGFADAPPLLAYGGELESTFCLVQRGEATLSQHQGDLEDVLTLDEYEQNLGLYAELLGHTPTALVCDRHPEYLSTKLARARAASEGLPLIEVQHQHAHVAACLVDNDRPLDAPPVLGIVLDGLGLGDDGALWGGELLVADYRRYRRAGTFKPVALLGGAAAAREPWRNLYAHLTAELGWPALGASFADLDVYRRLEAKPRAALDAMVRGGVNVPLASSCGRLFDAVAAALGLCFESQAYEGEAAMRLEAIVDEEALHYEDEILAYPMATPRLRGSGLPYIEPLPTWYALLGDLALGTPRRVMAARFHRGLARAVATLARKIADRDGLTTVALAGGCFQNRVLFDEVTRRLDEAGLEVLTCSRVPPNDGGLALGQAAIGAAARLGAR